MIKEEVGGIELDDDLLVKTFEICLNVFNTPASTLDILQLSTPPGLRVRAYKFDVSLGGRDL